MPSQELIEFIKKELQMGIPKETIVSTLLTKGWKNEQVEEAFSSINSGNSALPQTNATSKSNLQTTPTNYLPRIFTLFREALGLYRLNLKKYVLINLLTLVAFVFFFILIIVTLFFAQNSLLFPTIVIPLILIVLFFLSFLSNLAIIYAVSFNYSVKLSYQNAVRKLLPFIGLSIISSIIVLISSLFLIFPGIIAAIFLVFTSYVFVVENKSIFSSLISSKNYVKPYLFEVFVRIIEFGFLISIISSVLNAIPIVGFFVSYLFISPLIVVFSYLFYTKVKALNGQKISNPLPRRVKYEVFGLIGIFLVGTIIFIYYFTYTILKTTSLEDLYKAFLPTSNSSSNPKINSSNIQISPTPSPYILPTITISPSPFPIATQSSLNIFPKNEDFPFSSEGQNDKATRQQTRNLQIELAVYKRDHETFPAKLEDAYGSNNLGVQDLLKKGLTYENFGNDYLLCINFETLGKRCTNSSILE